MEKSLGRNSMDVEKFRDLSKRCHDVAVANQKKEQDYEDAPGITENPCFTYLLKMGHCTVLKARGGTQIHSNTIKGAKKVKKIIYLPEWQINDPMTGNTISSFPPATP